MYRNFSPQERARRKERERALPISKQYKPGISDETASPNTNPADKDKKRWKYKRV